MKFFLLICITDIIFWYVFNTYFDSIPSVSKNDAVVATIVFGILSFIQGSVSRNDV